MVSIIIPSRNERWLQKTLDDLLSKAEGEIEIIVVMDGIWQPINEDSRIVILHHGTHQSSMGMRASINAGMAVAKGEYVMKIDGHCMVDQGYDVKLVADCEDNWVVIPRRYRLDVEEWKIIEDGRPPVDYMFLAYPYERKYDKTCGLHGDIWNQLHYDRKDTLVDDVMTMQGSCYFMSKKHWDWLGGLDESLYGPFTHESQEISNKTWLGGGRVVVNKKTWYAHLHKGKKYGTGYGFSNAQWKAWAIGHEKGRSFCIDYWMNDQWPDRIRPFEWMIEKFWPIPTWPENWREQIKIDEQYDFRHSEDGKKLHQQLKEVQND